MKELMLSASKLSWKMSFTHGTEYDIKYVKKYKKIWDSVWKRDDYTCKYCNFKSLKYQEINHINSDHDDNRIENLETICPLCHQSFHLDILSNTNGGKIIWLPELSQQELNYICRGLFIAIDEAEIAEEEDREVSGYIKIARMIETSLTERALVVEQRIHAGASDPLMFATALINMDSTKYNNRKNFLNPFKIMHLKNRYSKQTKYWKSKTYNNIPPNTWADLINKI